MCPLMYTDAELILFPSACKLLPQSLNTTIVLLPFYVPTNVTNADLEGKLFN